MFLLASYKDLTARLLPIKKGLGGKPFLFLCHHADVVGAFFATDKKKGELRGFIQSPRMDLSLHGIWGKEMRKMIPHLYHHQGCQSRRQSRMMSWNWMVGA
jgi:hypothetical protein